MEVLSEDFKKKASFLEINNKNPRPLRKVDGGNKINNLNQIN